MRNGFDSKKQAARSILRLAGTPLGFTLAELIVVITVLAILATVGFVALSEHLSSARDSSRAAEVGGISRAVELSAVQNGKYPMPAASESVALVSFTGGVSGNAVVTQWAATAANVRDLGGSFWKRKQTGPYAYSVLGDGAAYQVAAEFENGVSASPGFPGGTPEAYAASKTAYVEGTYRADPSLPSLVVSSGSVTGTGLFSPDACFVTHGGSNLFSTSSGCAPKKSLALKSLDSGLVGYWDMETLCVSGSCGAGNDGKLADLSGNGNHGSWSGNASPTQTWWLAWKGMFFNSGTIILGEDFAMWLNNEGMTFEFVVNNREYANPYPRILYNRHLWISYSNCAAFPTQSNCATQLAEGKAINTFGAYVQSMSWTTVLEAVNDDPVRTSNIAMDGKFYLLSVTYAKGGLKTYVNGTLAYEYSIPGAILRFDSPTSSTAKLVILGWFPGTNRTRDFIGTIDETKIYSRALESKEISQHASAIGLR